MWFLRIFSYFKQLVFVQINVWMLSYTQKAGTCVPIIAPEDYKSSKSLYGCESYLQRLSQKVLFTPSVAIRERVH